MTTPRDAIRHQEAGAHGGFFIEREGRRVAELTYSAAGDAIVVGHTYVDPNLRGGTLARDLVDAMVQWAREEHLKVVPVCSYVRAVFDRSDEYDDLRKD